MSARAEGPFLQVNCAALQENLRLARLRYENGIASQLDVLDADCTVIEQLDRKWPLVGEGTKRNLLGAFQFSGDEQDKRIAALR